MAKPNRTKSRNLALFLAGDVMTGRGIDQALPQSVDPVLYDQLLPFLIEYENRKLCFPGNFFRPASMEEPVHKTFVLS